MPGRTRAQETDRSTELATDSVGPAPVGPAPPTLDALTAGGNGAMSRLMSAGGGPAGLSVDPLQSLLDGGEPAVPAMSLATQTRIPDAPPETGTGAGGSGGGTGGGAGS